METTAISRAVIEARRQELHEAEGMAWAELHAIQGRIAEVELWLTRMEGVGDGSDNQAG